MHPTRADSAHFHNSSFFNIGGNYIHLSSEEISEELDRQAIRTLHDHCAIEATHEASSAPYAPKCHPGTREPVIRDILTWTTMPDLPILYFSGPAGGGKTCIQHEVVRRLITEMKTFGASFRFSAGPSRIREKEGPSTTPAPQWRLDDEKSFVATLVCQFLQSLPATQPGVIKAIREDSEIFKKSLDVQLQRLILDVLAKLPFADGYQLVLVIDGINECRDPSQRQHLLNLVRTLVTTAPSLGLRIRAIISCRPELDIRTTFEHEPFKSLTYCLRLQDYNGTQDIRGFFTEEFKRIRERHPARLTGIPVNWPIKADIDILTCRASSQFLYASTVIKYVGDAHHNKPMDRLRKILEYPSQRSGASTEGELDNPFALVLDPLYDLVLHAPEAPEKDIELIKRLLHVIMEMNPPSGLTTSHSLFLDAFLGLGPGTTDTALRDLHSVLDVPAGGGLIQFHHKSLKEYLSSRARSKDMYQSKEDTAKDLAARCSYHLTKWGSGNMADYGSPMVSYSRDNWERYMEMSLPPISPPPRKRSRASQSSSDSDATSGKEETIFSLPSTILEFDPTIIVRHILVHGPSSDFDPFRSWSSVLPTKCVLKKSLHDNMCGQGPCLDLCLRLGHIEANLRGITDILQNMMSDASSVDEDELLVLHKLDRLLGVTELKATSRSQLIQETAEQPQVEELVEEEEIESVLEGEVENRDTLDGEGNGKSFRKRVLRWLCKLTCGLISGPR